MSRRDEIKWRLQEIEDERATLKEELERDERADHYREYLRKLVEADIAEPLVKDFDSAFKDEALRWLAPQESKSRELSIKDWVIATIGESPAELTPADLRDRFKKEFAHKHVASLRQYLANRLKLVRKDDGKLVLTTDGQAAFQKLSKTKRG